MTRLVATAALALLVGCGGDHTAALGARVEWAPTKGAPVPSGLGPTVVLASTAMLAAARGEKPDPRFTCEKDDLGATPAGAKEELAPLGETVELVTATVTLELDAKAEGFEAHEVVDDPGAKEARVVVRGKLLVSSDANASWLELRAYLSALEKPSDDRETFLALIEPLREPLVAFIAHATSGACDVHLTEDADMERIPALDRHTRTLATAKTAVLKAELPRTCKTISRGTGQWGLHVSHVEAVFRNGALPGVPRTGRDVYARLRSKVRLASGAPCLGPVEVLVESPR